VQEGRRLEGVVLALPVHERDGDAAQLAVHQFNQPAPGLGLAGADGVQQDGDVSGRIHESVGLGKNDQGLEREFSQVRGREASANPGADSHAPRTAAAPAFRPYRSGLRPPRTLPTGAQTRCPNRL
jgi:hypothetical protein